MNSRISKVSLLMPTLEEEEPIIGGYDQIITGNEILDHHEDQFYNNEKENHKNRLWKYTNSHLKPPPTIRMDSTQDSCALKLGGRNECCSASIDEDERRLIDPDVVRDIVIGLSDGLTVPFGLTAGLSSLGSSQIVVLAGFAELISGAISMAIGGYLASESERDHVRYRQKVLKNRVARSCSGQMEKQVEEILAPLGIRQSLCRAITSDLLKAENLLDTSLAADHHNSKASPAAFRSLLRMLSRKPKAYDELLPRAQSQSFACPEGCGMTEFLLKFGEGMEEVPTMRLYISAFTIGVSYFLGGLIPLAPYFLVEKASEALLWSCGVMFLTLLVFGAWKAYFTGARIGVIGYIKGSASTIIVGGGAAAASYAVVKLLDVKT